MGVSNYQFYSKIKNLKEILKCLSEGSCLSAKVNIKSLDIIIYIKCGVTSATQSFTYFKGILVISSTDIECWLLSKPLTMPSSQVGGSDCHLLSIS